MRPKEEPEQSGPRQGAGEESLDRPIAAALAGPTRNPEHGDTTGHGEQGQCDTAELADRGHSHLRMQAEQEYYNVRHRLLSFLRCGCLQDTQRYDKSLVRATSILAKVLLIKERSIRKNQIITIWGYSGMCQSKDGNIS